MFRKGNEVDLLVLRRRRERLEEGRWRFEFELSGGLRREGWEEIWV